MKHRTLILALTMYFIACAVFGGGQKTLTVILPDPINVHDVSAENRIPSPPDPQPSPQVRADRLPVTWEIVNMVRNSGTNNFGDLDFYLSKPFSMKIEDPAKNQGFDVNNRALVIGDQNSSETIQFTTSEKGKYIDFSETRAGSEFFVILFQDKTLQFERNAQRDCFTLVSVSVDGKAYSIRVDVELPRLEIGGTDSRSTEIRAVPAAAGDRSTPSGGNYSVVQVGNSRTQPSREVMGAGSVTKEGVIQYIRSSRNSSPVLSSRDIGLLIDIYFREARDEGINHDIAIAQMLYATNFLSNQRTTTHNYAGLSTEGLRWDGRFRDMTTGVRAHIQHLKGYASIRRPSNVVDPRYDLLGSIRGSVTTFEQVYRTWMPYNYVRYGNEIEWILNGLYRYSGY